MPKKLLLSVAATAAAFSLAACGAEGEEDTAPEDTEQNELQDPEAMPEPDLDDIPDVVAEINGEEIDGDAFAQNYEAQYPQLTMQAQMTGEEVDEEELRDQALEMMINSQLLVTDAEDQGFTASDEEVDEYLSTMAEESGLESSDELVSQLEEQGLSEEQIRDEVHAEVLMEQVVDTVEVDEPTDEELEEIYDMQVAQQEAMAEQAEGEEQEVPSFEEMEPELEEQAEAQKENEALGAYIEDLRDDAEIETHL